MLQPKHNIVCLLVPTSDVTGSSENTQAEVDNLHRIINLLFTHRPYALKNVSNLEVILKIYDYNNGSQYDFTQTML